MRSTQYTAFSSAFQGLTGKPSVAAGDRAHVPAAATPTAVPTSRPGVRPSTPGGAVAAAVGWE